MAFPKIKLFEGRTLANIESQVQTFLSTNPVPNSPTTDVTLTTKNGKPWYLGSLTYQTALQSTSDVLRSQVFSLTANGNFFDHTTTANTDMQVLLLRFSMQSLDDPQPAATIQIQLFVNEAITGSLHLLQGEIFYLPDDRQARDTSSLFAAVDGRLAASTRYRMNYITPNGSDAVLRMWWANGPSSL